MSFLSNRWFVLVVVVVCVLPISMDTTILHIAIPTLSAALGASASEALWIIDIYSLIVAGLLIALGTLGDRIGHKRLMVGGLAVFGIASAFAAFSPTPEALIASRALLGVGAAMVTPGTVALIRQVFEDDAERAVAIGIWTTVSSTGIALGPIVGGFLLERFWWGSVFIVNVPFALLAAIALQATLPNRPGAADQPWHPVQALMLVAGTVAVVHALKSVVRPGAAPGAGIAVALFGLLLLWLFVRRQLRESAPMLDLGLLARPPIAIGIVTAFVSMIALSGYELLFAQELQYVHGLTPLEAGALMMPVMIAVGVAGPVAGGIVAKLGLRVVFTGGLLATAASLYGLALAHPIEQMPLTISLLAVMGFSIACVLVASSAAVMGAAPVEKAGAAGSIEATAYQLGIGLGVALFGVLVGALYSSRLVLPDGVAGSLSPLATNTVAVAIEDAERIGGDLGAALAEAARTAFSGSHAAVLIVSGTMMVLLAGFSCRALRPGRGSRAPISDPA